MLAEFLKTRPVEKLTIHSWWLKGRIFATKVSWFFVHYVSVPSNLLQKQWQLIFFRFLPRTPPPGNFDSHCLQHFNFNSGTLRERGENAGAGPRCCSSQTSKTIKLVNYLFVKIPLSIFSSVISRIVGIRRRAVRQLSLISSCQRRSISHLYIRALYAHSRWSLRPFVHWRQTLFALAVIKRQTDNFGIFPNSVY